MIEERPVVNSNGTWFKKRRLSTPPTMIMQETTFEGVRKIENIIATKLDMLSQLKTEYEKIFDAVVGYFDEISLKQHPSFFKDIFYFRNFCYERAEDIESKIGIYDEENSILQYQKRLIVREILSFCLNKLRSILDERYEEQSKIEEEKFQTEEKIETEDQMEIN